MGPVAGGGAPEIRLVHLVSGTPPPAPPMRQALSPACAQRHRSAGRGGSLRLLFRAPSVLPGAGAVVRWLRLPGRLGLLGPGGVGRPLCPTRPVLEFGLASGPPACGSLLACGVARAGA